MCMSERRREGRGERDAWMSSEAEENIGYPGARVSSGCEPSNIGAKFQILVLWKIKCF